MVEQHCAVALCGVEIPRPISDRARPLTQDAAQGQGLANGIPFIDVVVDDAERPIWKSLQPKDPSLKIMSRHPHIVPHADDPGLFCQGHKLGECAVDMTPRLSL